MVSWCHGFFPLNLNVNENPRGSSAKGLWDASGGGAVQGGLERNGLREARGQARGLILPAYLLVLQVLFEIEELLYAKVGLH